jgi:hypothetical protein
LATYVSFPLILPRMKKLAMTGRLLNKLSQFDSWNFNPRNL